MKKKEDKEEHEGMELAKRIGLRIKIARLKAGMLQKDLAEKVGFHRMSISAIESGRRFTTIPQLVAFAKALNVPVSYFLTGAEEEMTEAADEYTAEMEKALGRPDGARRRGRGKFAERHGKLGQAAAGG